ncbi:MAG: 50S ribosomal protein L19e [Nanoarchaeota archaeon]
MNQKRKLAAKILKISPKKVKFAPEALSDIQKAITRSDFRGLIAVGKVRRVRGSEQSRVRARHIAAQKQKGRRQGRGSAKGRKHAIVSSKEVWIHRIRVQREFIKELRDKKLLSIKDYRVLYRRSKGGFFRNKRHIKLYLTEHHLIRKQGEGAGATV